MFERAACLLGVAALVPSGCAHTERLRIELAERHGSGISGVVELASIDEGRATKVTVVESTGGRVTSVRVAFAPCGDGLNDRYVIRAPEGVIQLPYELVEEAIEDRQPIAAEFVTGGRFVACGELGVTPRDELETT